MSFDRAVLLIDNHNARIMKFNATEVETETVSEKVVYTRQHNSQVRTEHEFFAEVCEALAGTSDILVVGTHMGQADFRRNIEKHHIAVSKCVIGWETVDHPTDPQLLAFARDYFANTRHQASPSSPTSE